SNCALERCPLRPFPTRRSSDLTINTLGFLLPSFRVPAQNGSLKQTMFVNHYNRRVGAFRRMLKRSKVLESLFIETGMSQQHLRRDRKSTRLNSSHVSISYAVFC